MGAAVEAHGDFAFGDDEFGRHIDQVAKDLTRLSITVAAHALGDQAIEAAGKHEQGHVVVDLHGDRRRQCVI
jgi:predicted amidohydrolase YtcJ